MRSWIPLAAIAFPWCLPLAVAQENAADSGGGFVLGGEEPPPVPQAKVPASADFSEGLKQLAALGLPEMKDAQWVKPPPGFEEEESIFTQSYEFREVRIKLKGG